MSKLPELLPCPFCGCRMEMEFDYDGPAHEYDRGWSIVIIAGDHSKDCPFSHTDENGIVFNLDCDDSIQKYADIWNRRV